MAIKTHGNDVTGRFNPGSQDDNWMRSQAAAASQAQPLSPRPTGAIMGANETAAAVSEYAGNLADRAETLVSRLLGSCPIPQQEPVEVPVVDGAIDEIAQKMRAGLRSMDRINAAFARLDNALSG